MAAPSGAGRCRHQFPPLRRPGAGLAERGRLDALFLADTVGVWPGDDDSLSRMARVAHFEPLTLLSALAAVTSHVGLIATVTTTYNEPYHLARKFASLDHISGGRSGWNLVTSSNPDEALNFNRDAHAAHADRYRRAGEFAEVVLGLWDSWDDDAFIRDKASGVFFEPLGMHVQHHKGERFPQRPRSTECCRGRRKVGRSWCRPASSEPGKDLAAETAEAVSVPHTRRWRARRPSIAM